MKRLTATVILALFTIALLGAMPKPAQVEITEPALTMPVSALVHIATQPAPPPEAQPPKQEHLLPMTFGICAESIALRADAELIARVLWSECRGESRDGQLMCAQVIVDRLACGEWGDTVESVVYWPNQFAKPGELTDELYEVAVAALTGERFSDDTILYFRATKSTKGWFAPYLGHVGGHAYYGYGRNGE